MKTSSSKSNKSKEFVCGLTSISRQLLEELPCPFNTEGVSDETMQRIALSVEIDMKEWYEWQSDGSVTDDKVNEVWWQHLEAACVREKIPYYEDQD